MGSARGVQGSGVNSNKLLGEDEKVKIPQVPEGRGLCGCWGRSILGRGKSQCKGPGVLWKLGMGQPLHGVELAQDRALAGEVREVQVGQLWGALLL